MTPLARILSVLLVAFLWQGVAHADLDRVRGAAEAGDAKAQLELGILFEYGFHYKDNEIPALTWYILSANQGNAKAAKLRDALKAKMTEKEVQEAMEQAAQFKPAPAVETPKQEQPAAAPAPETMPAEPAPATAPSAVPETTPPAPVETAPAPAAEPMKESLPAQPATAPPAEETRPAETAPSATQPEAK